jgi:hypothetical protein
MIKKGAGNRPEGVKMKDDMEETLERWRRAGRQDDVDAFLKMARALFDEPLNKFGVEELMQPITDNPIIREIKQKRR